MRVPITIFVDIDFDTENDGEDLGDGDISPIAVQDAVWNSIEDVLAGDEVVDAITDATGFCIKSIAFTMDQ